MAKVIEKIEKRTDDLDGSDDAKPHTFAIDGTVYKIDLTDENFEAFEKRLAKYVAVARTRKARGEAPEGAGDEDKSAAKERLNAIRTWARNKGKEVSDRGRLPNDLIQAYDDAMAKKAAKKAEKGKGDAE